MDEKRTTVCGWLDKLESRSKNHKLLLVRDDGLYGEDNDLKKKEDQDDNIGVEGNEKTGRPIPT